jgi:hypothetical protein
MSDKEGFFEEMKERDHLVHINEHCEPSIPKTTNIIKSENPERRDGTGQEVCHV